jgi:hypothetical protein
MAYFMRKSSRLSSGSFRAETCSEKPRCEEIGLFFREAIAQHTRVFLFYQDLCDTLYASPFTLAYGGSTFAARRYNLVVAFQYYFAAL